MNLCKDCQHCALDKSYSCHDARLWFAHCNVVLEEDLYGEWTDLLSGKLMPAKEERHERCAEVRMSILEGAPDCPHFEQKTHTIREPFAQRVLRRLLK